jgi:menaquinone-dependent protoporphyrinogen oxidase
MTKILILYGTTEGHTTKIANHISTVLKAKGHETEVRIGTDLPSDFSLEKFGAIIIGASIHVGKHQSYIGEFVKTHLPLLERIPSAFFLVSLTAGSPKEEDRVPAMHCATKFLREIGWQPRKVGIFAGALQYTQYGFIKRFIMKMIAKRAGGSTDTSRDYEYTNWDSVTRFAEEFSALLG